MAEDWHLYAPRDPKKNLNYRQKLLKLTADPEAKRAIKLIVSKDFLFWLNTYCWVYEPRGPFTIPFCSWKFQEDTFRDIFQAMEDRNDVCIEKSRDMGVSWIAVAVIAYLFMFCPGAVIGVMTRNEDLASSTTSPKSIFWKILFILDHMPLWLRPSYRIDQSQSLIINTVNGATIQGTSTTKDSARGDRYLMFFMDEASSFDTAKGYAAYASTQFTTNTRLLVGTPQGMVGVFSDVMHDKKLSRVKKISLHWTLHPLKRRGLYTSERGKLRILDRDYKYPENYRFILDGKQRSVWYDKEWGRNPSQRFFAQEVDIDYGGAGSPYFDCAITNEHKKKYGRPPMRQFMVDFSTETHTLELVESHRGDLLVWFPTIKGDYDHGDDCAIGCDIATGRGGDEGTNSVASIASLRTGEKIAEYASNLINPADFGHLVIALRKWFSGPNGDAWLIWEANGPGGIFGRTIMEFSPAKVYYRQREKARVQKRTNEPGWWNARIEKGLLLGKYQESLKYCKFINHHVAALDECGHYVFTKAGTIEHDRSMVEDDPSNAGENHGDRVIADALCCRLITQLGGKAAIEQPKMEERSNDPRTMAGRFAMHVARERAQREVWY